jgi:hypothetical protein
MELTESEAYQHTRTCASCRRGVPCYTALREFYGGGLLEVDEGGIRPATSLTQP